MEAPSISSARAALRDHGPEPQPGSEFAAVAILLCECKVGDSASEARPDKIGSGAPIPHLLLIERAAHPQDPWSGHLAFPGGRQDPSDDGLLATAVRETYEEIGMRLRPEQHLLGRLAPLRARGAGRPGLVVEPFVFEVAYQATFVVDPTEVARAFWVPVQALTTGERDTFIEIQRGADRFRMPAYQIEEHLLWGMTYEMFRSLAKVAQWLQ